MMTNADCTLYRFNKETQGYDRFFIPDVYWHENKAGNVLKSGLQNADSTTVYIYDACVLPENPAKDMLVKGNCLFEFDNTSQQTVSQSIKEFCRLYKPLTVSSIDDYSFGSLSHFEVSAK